ncbi:MAG: rod shape-determining protein MreC [Candidatus Paceibacterota bacterium]
MNPRNSSFPYAALFLAVISIAVGVYWYGPAVHREVSYLLPDTVGATSTVVITSDRLARLQQEAAIGRRLQRVQDSLLVAAGTSSVMNWIGTSTPHQAEVIGRPPQSPYDTLVISIGADRGVELGAGVWWPAGVYLGEVVDVRSETSIVQLVSSSGVEHPAFVGQTPIKLHGRGGDELYAEVSENLDIAIGDAVISDVYELPIGVVATIRELPTTNQKALYIARFISSSVLQNVYVES